MAKEYNYTKLFEKANKEIDLLENSSNKQEQDIYIEVKMSLLEIQQMCNEDNSVPIWEVVQKYYDNALNLFISSQEKKLKDAKKYCELQKETPEETEKIIANVKHQLQVEAEKFKNQYNHLFEALDLKLNENAVLIPI